MRIRLPKEVVLLEHYQNLDTPRGGYLKGLALDCFQNPEKDRQSHYFAREMMYTGRFRSAIKEFERHVAMNRWLSEKAQSVVYIGECYDKLGFPDLAVSAWQESFNMEPARREPLIRLAQHSFYKGEHQKTAVYASGALTIPSNGFYADDSTHYRQWPHEMLYWALWNLGDKEGSAKHWMKCLNFIPSHPKYQHDAIFYAQTGEPIISVILPTLGRERGLERALASIRAQTYPQDRIQIIVLDGEGTVPEKVAKGLALAFGEYIVYAANDMEFDKDAFRRAVDDSKRWDKGLIAFNGPELLGDEGNICEHFLIKKSLIKDLENGELFSLEMHHVGVDNWLWAQAKKLGQAYRSTDAKFTHHHFSQGAEYDTVYSLGWKNAEQDREVLKRKLASLEATL